MITNLKIQGGREGGRGGLEGGGRSCNWQSRIFLKFVHKQQFNSKSLGLFLYCGFVVAMSM